MAGLSSRAGYVVDGACTACGACLLTCPTHAFHVGIPLQVDADRCTDCGECIEVCPVDAITRREIPADHGDLVELLSLTPRHFSMIGGGRG